jgi:hypothetical protein
MKNPAIPDGWAVCPKCNGSTREPIDGASRKYASVIAGYDPETHTIACRNCGGQTMGGAARGIVQVRPHTTEGCMHKFVGERRGNCYHVYHCEHGCGARYDIDSGD